MSKSFKVIGITLLICLTNAQFEYTNLTANQVPTNSNTTQVQNSINTKQNPAVEYYCPPGFFWSSQECMSCQQVPNGYCSCNSFGGCDQLYCFQGYFSYDGVTCTSCGIGCNKCSVYSSALLCYSCDNHYQLIGSTCVPKSNCNLYSNSTAICNECNPGYYFNWLFTAQRSNPNRMLSATLANQPAYLTNFHTQCSACNSTCAYCNQADACIVCNAGYGLDQNQNFQCVQCSVSKCLRCDTNTTQCTKCTIGYFLTTASQQSAPQNSSAPVTTTTVGDLCAACDSNCVACIGKGQCIQCSSNYNLYQGTCYSCNSGCNVCENQSLKCSQCSTGMIPQLNTTDTSYYTQCVSCPSNCDVCKYSGSNLVCQICQDTYIAVNGQCQSCSGVNSEYVRCKITAVVNPTTNVTTPKTEPTQCIQGYYVAKGSDGFNQCVQQTQSLPCYNVTLQNTTYGCINCLPGYVQYNNNCYQRPTFCSKLNDFNSSTNSFPCLICNSGYYGDSNGLCTACSQSTQKGMSACLQCSNSTKCTLCPAGYTLNTTENCQSCSVQGCSSCLVPGNCTQCLAGYFRENATSCVPCPSNCDVCEATGASCTVCSKGYFLQGFSCVSSANANCLTSSSSGCTICMPGYYLSGKFCAKCINPDAGFVCRPNYFPPVVSVNNTNASNQTNGSIPKLSNYGKLLAVVYLVMLLLI